MGVCCNFINKETSTFEEQASSGEINKPIKTMNIQNNDSTSKENKNILRQNQQLRDWSQQKDTLPNNNNIDKPDTIDKVFFDDNKYEISSSISMNENDYDLNFSEMENNLFNLINNLRSNPISFIEEIEKYKNMLIIEDDKKYIRIDDNEFEFKEGKECFDECINFLREIKKLEKFEKIQSMFESKNYFVDKNVSDLIFVIVSNLIDINNPEDNKIKRNCLLSEEYNKLNITITKNEIGSKLLSYYFSFD